MCDNSLGGSKTTMLITYTAWDKTEKTWNPQTEGHFYLRVAEEIKNADGSFFRESTMGIFSTLCDVHMAWKCLLCVRPELRGVVTPVKALCSFDVARSSVNVERW